MPQRERETERDRDRDRGRDSERQTDRQTDRLGPDGYSRYWHGLDILAMSLLQDLTYLNTFFSSLEFNTISLHCPGLCSIDLSLKVLC